MSHLPPPKVVLLTGAAMLVIGISVPPAAGQHNVGPPVTLEGEVYVGVPAANPGDDDYVSLPPGVPLENDYVGVGDGEGPDEPVAGVTLASGGSGPAPGEGTPEVHLVGVRAEDGSPVSQAVSPADVAVTAGLVAAAATATVVAHRRA